MISSKALIEKLNRLEFNKIFFSLIVIYGLVLKSQELPDDVNYVKYNQIYQSAKSVSDAKRNQAEILREQAQRIQNTLDSKVALLDSSRKTLQSNLQLMSRLERDLPIWESQRSDTINQINWNMNRIRNLDSQLTQLSLNLRQISEQLQIERSKLSSLDLYLRQSSSELQRVNQNLQSLESFLAQAPSQKHKLESEITQTTETLRNIVESLEQLENGLPDIENQISQAQEGLAQARKNLADVQQNLSSAKQSLDQAQIEFNSKKSALDLLNKELSDVLSQIDLQEKDLNATKIRLSENEEATAQNIEKRRMLNHELNQLNKKLKELIANDGPESEIMNTRERIAKIQQVELPRYEDENDLLIKAKSRITARITTLNTQISSLRSKSLELKNLSIPAANTNLSVSQTALNEAKENFDRINEAVNSIKQSISSIEQSIRELNLSKEEVNKQIVSLNQQKIELERSLTIKGQQLGELQIRIDQAQSDLLNIKRQSEQLTNRVRDLQSQVNSQQLLVSQIQQQRNQTEANLQNVQFERNSVAQTLDRLNLSLSQLSAQIDQGKRNYEQARSQNIKLNSDIVGLEFEIPGLTSASKNAWNQFAQADQEAKPFELDTQNKLNKLIAVKSAYDSELAQAQSKGSSQGNSQGQVAGKNQGETDGSKLGLQDGSILGKEQGLIFGFEKGKVDGKSQGQVDGYQAGLNAPENYKEGLDRGLVQGKQNAQMQAMTQVYPREKDRLKALLLSQTPNREVELDNLSQRNLNLISTGYFSGYSLDQKQMLNQTRGNDKSLFRLAIVGNRSKNSVAFDSHVVSLLTNKKEADCQLRHPDFTSACLSAFEKSYQLSYSEAYQKQHKTSYEASKEIARLKAFEENKTIRYKEGFDLAYAAAFAIGNQQGAQQAKDRGYADGLKQGFDSSIENENRLALQKAKVDNDVFFASNPVVRLKSAQLIKVSSQFGTPQTEITAGDTLSLKVDLANLGLKDSQLGDVKIKLESLSASIATENLTNQIVSLPSQTLSKVKNAAIAKVTLSAVDEIAQLKLTIMYPDSVTEEKIISVKLKAFFVAGLDLSRMPLRPNAVNFAGNPNVTRFKVGVTNKAPIQAQEDVSIELSSPMADNGNGLAFMTKQASLGRLAGNATQDVEFAFRTAKTAIGKIYPITILVKYGDRVIMSEVVEVRPK